METYLSCLQGDLPKQTFKPRFRMKGKSKSGRKENRKQIMFEADKRVSYIPKYFDEMPEKYIFIDDTINVESVSSSNKYQHHSFMFGSQNIHSRCTWAYIKPTAYSNP